MNAIHHMFSDDYLTLSDVHSIEKQSERIDDSISGYVDHITFTERANSAISAELESLFRESQNELMHYLSFGPGWDGYFAERFEPDTINRALQVLDVLESKFRLNGTLPSSLIPGPVSDGSINIELSSAAKSLILTIMPDKSELLCYERDGETTLTDDQPIDWATLGKKLSWLAG